jgi:hypothetical protein
MTTIITDLNAIVVTRISNSGSIYVETHTSIAEAIFSLLKSTNVKHCEYIRDRVIPRAIDVFVQDEQEQAEIERGEVDE